MKPEKHIDPPQWIDGLLTLFCSKEVVESLQGDLHELYQKRRAGSTKVRANIHFLLEVLDVCRPFAWRKRSKVNSNITAMFYNYFKVAWRNLSKYKMYSFIKIGGFAVGIAAFILICLFVKDELSFDKHYKNSDRIFRVVNVHTDPADFGKWTAFPAQIGEILGKQFPEIEKAGRLIPYDWFDAGSNQFRRSDRRTSNYEEGFAYADNSLLEILEIPMVYGEVSSALSEPNSLVISKSKADKYFPGEDPVGKTIILNEDQEKPFTIGGVMEDFPKTSHLQYDYFITLTAQEFWPGEQTNWCCWNYNPYILVRDNVDPRDLEEKLLLIRDNYIVKFAEEQGDQRVEETKKYHSFILQPVANIRLYSDDTRDIIQHGDIKIVWLFIAIAIFIILLACINFINLSTAKSANRAKEVGLRKVVGSFRKHLIQQFLAESMMFSAISVALGLGLSYLLLTGFNHLAGKSLEFPWAEWWLGPLSLLFIIVIGFLAGLYPALYLSKFKPIEVLKGSLSRGSKGSSLRSAMVIFQFTTSIVLIVSAFVVQKQMGFILNKELGYDKDQVIMVQGANTLGERLNTFKNEIATLSEVQGVAYSNYLPVAGTKRDQNSFWKEGKDKIDKGVGAQIWSVDKDYIKTLGMKLVAGQGFTDRASDSSAIIINQQMVEALNLEEPIGARIQNWIPYTVIGVVEDFHFENMKQDIEPLCFTLSQSGSIVTIKVNTKDMTKTMTSISGVWESMMPNQPIRYTFLDQTFASMYEDVERAGNVFSVFAILAILVACLGLFGLSAFMVEQRNKEISIRKVLGASIQTILRLLTLNFVKMVIISMIIAIPLGWYMMTNWLQDFKYSVEMTWDVFLWAGIIVLLIALITVSYESIKAAFTNPVNGLRSE